MAQSHGRQPRRSMPNLRRFCSSERIADLAGETNGHFELTAGLLWKGPFRTTEIATGAARLFNQSRGQSTH